MMTHYHRLLNVYIYILICPPFINIMLNIEGWSSLPRAEAIKVLGTVPIGLNDILYLSPARTLSDRLCLFYHIIIYPSSTPTLLSLYLRFFCPRLLSPLH